MTKKQRIAVSIAAGAILWVALWGTAGYFGGLRGVGFGWPAFWAVGGMSLLVPAIVGTIGGLVVSAYFWIGRAEK